MLNQNITFSMQDIEVFSRRYPIRKLSLFGSVLRDDFTPQSDVDVLVEFMPGARVTYFDLVDMQDALAEILGRKVDLLTLGAISDYILPRVLETAQVVYDEGAAPAAPNEEVRYSPNKIRAMVR